VTKNRIFNENSSRSKDLDTSQLVDISKKMKSVFGGEIKSVVNQPFDE
jgi:hypothetical protein